MKINTKQKAVMQVLPHLNSGGLVSGAVEVAKELVNSNFKSLVVSSGGYKENEIIRNNSILEKLPVHSKNIFTILNNKKKLIDLAIKYNIHLIHARSRAPAWSAYFAAKELNLPFVTTFHGTYGTENFFSKIKAIHPPNEEPTIITGWFSFFLISKYASFTQSLKSCFSIFPSDEPWPE